MRMRTLNRIYAAIAGYFWTACPLCGEYFGGHEWRDIDGRSSSIKTSESSRKGICPDCTRAGKGSAE